MKLVKTLKVLGATTAISAMAFGATAATFTQDSFVEILDALTLTETQQLNFGVIEKPTSAVVVAVDTAGSVAGASTATHLDASSVAAGTYDITGSAGSTVEISATDGANVAGLAFTAMTGSFAGGSDTDILGGSITGATLTAGPDSLAVGAELTVQNTVVAGQYAPEFDIVVNYE